VGLPVKFTCIRQISLLVFVVSSVFLSACGNKDIDALKKQGELIVLTRNAPTTWYQGREGEVGFEHDLIQSFAKLHGLKVKFKIVDNFEQLIKQIQNGEAHIAAAGITKTEARINKGYVFGPEYQQVQQQVVCRRSKRAVPKKIEDLLSRTIAVIKSSSYSESLQKLKLEYSDLKWDEVTESSTEQLLERVWKKEIDCTISDSNITRISRRYYPELVTAFSVKKKEPLAWVIAPKWKGIKDSVTEWLEIIKSSSEFATIDERYYGHIQLYDFVDNRSFNRRIKSRLPKYRKTFEKAAAKYDLPWTLLAAQSYQESHWNPRAKSPTGVRGMMMLTLNTAKSIGVKSRLNPTQSIFGGAKYLKKMIKRIPESVAKEDRVWYALAAYNVGYGHLKDAMRLAKQQDLNGNQWLNLKKILPLLSQKKYYKKLKYGYARGTEPVRYVQRIRGYQQVLEQFLVTAK